MVDDAAPIADREDIGRSRSISLGLRKIVQEIDGTAATDFEKADAIYRRGVRFLVREAANFLHTFAVLQFVHEITRPEWRLVPEDGVAWMTRLSDAPRDVPAYYYAFASDLLDLVVRRRARAIAREAKLGVEYVTEGGTRIRIKPEAAAPVRATA